MDYEEALTKKDHILALLQVGIGICGGLAISSGNRYHFLHVIIRRSHKTLIWTLTLGVPCGMRHEEKGG